MANIFLSVPILGKPCLKMIHSMYQAILSCPEHRVRVYYNENDSLIQRVRNVHISVYLNKFKECDYFMSLDSDIQVLNAYANNNIFSKLIAHDLDFVGGLYALKKQGERRSSSIAVDGSNPEFDTGLKEMRWLSSGCWCIKRSAVEKMYEAYRDELLYDGDDNASGEKVIALYDCMHYDMKQEDFPGTKLKLPYRKLLSEDWSLCERWRRIGGKIWADTSIVLLHEGSYNYSLWDVEVKKFEKPNSGIKTLPTAGFDLPKSK